MFCLIYKMRIAKVLDGGGELSPRLQRHVQRCSECRHFYLYHQALVGRLREEAPAGSRAFGAYLSDRVMSVLDCEGAAAEEDAVYPRGWGHALKAAVVMLAILGGVYFLVVRDAREPELERSAEPPRALMPDMGALETMVMTEMAPEETTDLRTLIEKPIKEEIQRLTADAASVAGTLLAFLPIEMAGKALEEKE